jgi:hypothetical protein
MKIARQQLSVLQETKGALHKPPPNKEEDWVIALMN